MAEAKKPAASKAKPKPKPKAPAKKAAPKKTKAEEAVVDQAAPEDEAPAEVAAVEEAPVVVAEVVADADEAPAKTPEEELADVVAAVEAGEEVRIAEAISADEAAAQAEAQKLVAKPGKGARYQATGKRKTSVARVILTPGDGTFWINGRTLEDYFPRHGLRTAVMEPLNTADAATSFSIRARIHGGGVSSQAGALRHGLAKALADIHPIVRTSLKSKGLLKLDARQVERKKAGLKKARKKPQFSKR